MEALSFPDLTKNCTSSGAVFRKFDKNTHHEESTFHNGCSHRHHRGL